MKSIEIQVKDFILNVDYEENIQEPNVNVVNKFNIDKVLIMECDQFQEWNDTLEDFKTDIWETLSQEYIKEFILDCYDGKSFKITNLNCFCTVNNCHLNLMTDVLDNFVDYGKVSKSDRDLSAKIISDFLCEDMRGLDVTHLIDTHEIDQLIIKNL